MIVMSPVAEEFREKVNFNMLDLSFLKEIQNLE